MNEWWIDVVVVEEEEAATFPVGSGHHVYIFAQIEYLIFVTKR